MISILQRPDQAPGSSTTGYMLQNTNMCMGDTGMINVTLDKANGSLVQGSVFELNGHLARVVEDTRVGGVIPREGRTYIYAVPNVNNTVGLVYNATAPEWNPTKGGWYEADTNNRALMVVFSSNQRAVLAHTLINELDVATVPPNAGGVSVGTFNTRTHTSVHLDVGWYRYAMASGATGNGQGGFGGGPGGNNNVSIGGAGGGGGVANIRNTIGGVFFHEGGSLIVHVGGNGANGQSGNPGNNGAGQAAGTASGGGGGGGGAGAGAGEESYIISGSRKFSTERAGPGGGGGGGAGQRGSFTHTPAPQGNTGEVGSVVLGGIGTSGGGHGGRGGGSILDKIFDTKDDGRYVLLNGTVETGAEGGAGVFGSSAVASDGSDGDMNDAGFGAAGGGGGGGGGSTSNTGGAGGSGAGRGAAPGWIRPLGDPAAGFVQVFRLGNNL